MTAHSASPRATERLAVLAALAAALACVVGGAGIVAMRALVAETDPITVAYLRNGIGAVVLLMLALVTCRRPVGRRDLLVMAAIGLVSFGVYQWMMAFALQYTTAGRAAVTMSVMPFMTLAIASFAGLERPSRRKLVGLVLASSGVAIALWKDATIADAAWRGDVVVLAASLVAAAAAVASTRYVRRYPPLMFVAAGLVPTSLALWAVRAANGTPELLPTLSTNGWIAAIWLGLAGAVVSYFLWHWALRHTTPTLVSVSITLNPVTALVLGAVVLGEEVTVGLLVGLAAVFAGIIVANSRRRGPVAGAEH